MGLLSASEKTSQRDWQLIKDAFAAAIEDTSNYTICYGYRIKNGLISKKMYNYALGFKNDPLELVCVPIDLDGNIIGDILNFTKENVSSIKKTLQAAWRITSSLTPKPLEITVPAFVPDTLGATYLLPINQQTESESFAAFAKSFT